MRRVAAAGWAAGLEVTLTRSARGGKTEPFTTVMSAQRRMLDKKRTEAHAFVRVVAKESWDLPFLNYRNGPCLDDG